MFTPKTLARATPGSGKTCLFCGRGGKMSKEHLWPKWAQAAIAPDQRGKKIRSALHDGPPGEPFKTWEAPVFEATLKAVCVGCNGGRMSKVEASAKPFAPPLMLCAGRRIGPRRSSRRSRQASSNCR